MSVSALRIKSREAVDDSTRTKTFSNLIFDTSKPIEQRYADLKVLAQTMVGLTTNSYVGSDYIITTDLDTYETTI